MMTPYEEILILAAARTAITTRYNDLKAVIEPQLEAGDQKRPMLAGVKLGSVSMSIPDAKAQVTDRDAFEKYMLEAGEAQEFPAIDTADLSEILAVLAEHAPHLIKTEIDVDPVDEAEAKKATLAGKDIPGVTVDHGTPRLTPTPSKEAKARAADALARGALAIEVAQ